ADSCTCCCSCWRTCCSCRKSTCCSQALIGTLFLRKKWLAGNCEPFFCIKPESVTVKAVSSGNSRSTWPDVATIESATNLLRWQLNRRRCRSRGVAARNGLHCHGFRFNAKKWLAVACEPFRSQKESAD